jgi:hypothetical protein
VQVTDVELPGWDLASRTSDVILDAEAPMAAALRETGVLALPTVPFFPPRLDAAIRPGYLPLTRPSVDSRWVPALTAAVGSRREERRAGGRSRRHRAL